MGPRRTGFASRSTVHFRTATAFTVNSEDGSGNSEIQIEHRYTVRVDLEWINTSGIVGFELQPPYYAVTTGNRLDNVDSLVEFTRNPEADKPEINVLVLEREASGDEGTFTTALTVRSE